ncbi:MAG TPA: hypothetical protein VM509_08930 [Planctomycetota bacterium]|nr:hypothetical protein [Planctomycetota bacterium]
MTMRALRRSSALLFASPMLLAAAPQASTPERILVIDMLDNGAGTHVNDAPGGDARQLMVPWWIASGTPRTSPPAADGLELAPGATLSQPLAAFAPYAERVLIRGRVEGRGHVRLSDGRGESLDLDVVDQQFELRADAFQARFGHAPLPRFVLELSAPAASVAAMFHDVRAEVAWPCPDEKALAAELRELCARVIRTWTERASDRDGARATAFMTTRFDAVTGLKIDAGSSPCIHPLFECLVDLCAISDDPEWHAALEHFLDDFFELGFHATTGLPRDWDGPTDLPQDKNPIEVGRYMTFLLDVHERGPKKYRERALAQVEKLAATILAKGQLPDGSLAVKFVPADGTPSLDVPLLRRLDVAAPLARLSRVNGDERLVEAARVALAALEFTHFWAGTWSTMDPDFDDSYGHWGSRAATMLTAFPDDKEFRRFSSKAFAHFAPIWNDALRFGGSMASDQNRCWELLERYADVEPAIRAPLDALVGDSIRAHLKGRQYANGSWGDCTFVAYSPRDLNIGDLTGYPANMLAGLAVACREGSSLRNDTTRALFTAVLRSSETFYRRDFGLLLRREESTGRNVAGADLRFLAAAVEMLKQL